MNTGKTLTGKICRYTGPWQVLCSVGENNSIGKRQVELQENEIVVILTKPEPCNWNTGYKTVQMKFVKILLSSGELAWMAYSNNFFRFFEFSS